MPTVANAPTLIAIVTRISGRTHHHKHALGSRRQLVGPAGVSALRHGRLRELRGSSPARLPGLTDKRPPSAAAGVATRASATCTAAHAWDTSGCGSSPSRPWARKQSMAAARNGRAKLYAQTPVAAFAR